jgi:hypothetical protein
MGIFFNIFFFIAGATLVYVAFYLRVKEINKELVENVKKLESDKTKILKRFIEEIEKTKQKHATALEKKKFQYEDKRAQFSKYFSLLSTFHEKTNTLCADKIQPIIKELLSDDERTKHKAIEKYNQDTQALIFDLNEEHSRVKAEQNNIRLIASAEVDSLLDELSAAVESVIKASTQMLAAMRTLEFINDQSIIKPYQKNLFSHGQVIQNIHTALKEQLKLELNEI